MSDYNWQGGKSTNGVLGARSLSCPDCGAALERLTSCNDPEGIRKDASCPRCSVTFMVTKGGLSKLR